MIRTSQPVIKVTLIKTIKRRNGQSERYDGPGKKLDLEPLLDDQSSVIVHKSINEQAGRFSVTLADKLIQPEPGAFQDSLYGWVEPMDVIEIRMGRDLHTKGKTIDNIPIVMRGFVVTVGRQQSVADNGSPIRNIVITGYDYGYILGITQIFYEKTYALGLELLTPFRLSTNFDVRFSVFTTAEFVQEVVEKVINKALSDLQEASALEVLPRIIPDTRGAKDGSVFPYGLQPFEGSIWELLRNWTDRYWNELFIEDREDGVYLVCRQMPYKGIDDEYIDNATDPGHVDVEYEHVKELNIDRSANNIANFYWVSSPRAALIGESVLKMAAYQKGDDYFLKDYQNASTKLYGIRKMEVRTEQGEAVHGLDELEHEANKVKLNAWIENRLNRLIKQNRDNVLFEDGHATVRGDNEIKPGKYLRFRIGSQDSGYDATYYCMVVTHEFLPFRSWLTKVELIRGDGFIKRSEMAGSPYLAERGKGAYE